MTLPADTRLNDSPALGPLTAADFDTYQSPETAMLLHQDFVDTMAMPRRQTAPMDFTPSWYRGGVAQCCGTCRQGRYECKTPDACRVTRQRTKVVGARFGFAALLISAATFITGLAALAVWY